MSKIIVLTCDCGCGARKTSGWLELSQIDKNVDYAFAVKLEEPLHFADFECAIRWFTKLQKILPDMEFRKRANPEKKAVDASMDHVYL